MILALTFVVYQFLRWYFKVYRFNQREKERSIHAVAGLPAEYPS